LWAGWGVIKYGDFITQPSLRSFCKRNCDYPYSESDLSQLLYYHVVPVPCYEVSFAQGCPCRLRLWYQRGPVHGPLQGDDVPV
jgi:hypothetical protein